MLWDVDALRAQWQERGIDPVASLTYGPGADVQRHRRSDADAR